MASNLCTGVVQQQQQQQPQQQARSVSFLFFFCFFFLHRPHSFNRVVTEFCLIARLARLGFDQNDFRR